MSMLMCKQIQPLQHIPTGGIDLPVLRSRHQKEKVVVIMGATGTGKSRLSIDLATRFPAEIVNSDKMQVYEGLDVVTNKITEEERCGVPHHLLGAINPDSDFTAGDFCNMASVAMKSVASRGQLPIIVGGSNSCVEALVDDDDYTFRSRYDCCFLWVDVSMPVLHSVVSARVDRMVDAGMVDEARKMFNPSADYSRGIRRAIGVPEFDRYFRFGESSDEVVRARLLQEAIKDTKINTRRLAWRQLEKIYRLRNAKGWKMHRLDATDVFRKHGREANKVWEELVLAPSMDIVSQFLSSFEHKEHVDARQLRVAAMGTAMAAATH
ncbi:hypothetical protein RJ639_043103 [Escallonia herrerae]|uniref:adenylate dimethylallyltransferase (ADP/ATP-dependent) n=1 Tax=Escallonia herrerae TaxID=1293975 RepID=A0AA88WAT8_9ASTE|nr:hypothetical protein RJ639_043103 [Escallonia herrerae]